MWRCVALYVVAGRTLTSPATYPRSHTNMLPHPEPLPSPSPSPLRCPCPQAFAQQPRSSLFAGVSIHVNGLTNPTHGELKQLMALHGGRFETYFHRSRVTHFICSNLPDTHLKKLAHARWVFEGDLGVGWAGWLWRGSCGGGCGGGWCGFGEFLAHAR